MATSDIITGSGAPSNGNASDELSRRAMARVHAVCRWAVLFALALCVAPASAQTRVDIHPGKVEIRSTAADALRLLGGIEFEGATANDFETQLTVTDPTADRTITIPNLSGTLALLGVQNVGSFEITTDITVGDQLMVSGAGPHAIGGATADNIQLKILGSFTAGASVNTFGIAFQPTLTAKANDGIYGVHVDPTLVEAGSGTHALITNVRITGATVTAGAASVTNTASLYIDGAMSATVTGRNYQGWFDGTGPTRFDGDLVFGGTDGVGRFTNIAGTNTFDIDVTGDAHTALISEGAPLAAAATRQTIGASNSVSGLLVLEDGTSGDVCIFALSASSGAATEISDPAAVCGVAAGVSNLNVYASVGQWTVQNNTVSNKTIRTMVLR